LATSPWEHLRAARGTNWPNPGVGDDRCHLIGVQMMEAWLVADRERPLNITAMVFHEASNAKQPKRRANRQAGAGSGPWTRATRDSTKRALITKTLHAPTFLERNPPRRRPVEGPLLRPALYDPSCRDREARLNTKPARLMDLLHAAFDFVLHLDRHLGDIIAQYGTVDLFDPLCHRLLRDRPGGDAVSAGRFAPVSRRHVCEAPRRRANRPPWI